MTAASARPEILYLSHRIPYPPNKGDKVRSFHLAKHLSQHYQVHLGAFVDDPSDWVYQRKLEEQFGEICLLPLNPRLGKIRSLTGLLRGLPLSLPYFWNPRMAAWVRELISRRPIRAVFLFSSPMAQYVEAAQGLRRVIDFVDVDSDKWRQYAERAGWPMNWIYRREARYLLRYERSIASSFDASTFVSPREANFFVSLAPETAGQVCAVENGVDGTFFSPSVELPNPYEAGGPLLVFTGAMDYWPNIDAVQRFAREVFPGLRERLPNVRFFIVGARPAAAVQALEEISGITVTGGVPDIRPYLKFANVAVAPLNIARGIQNKVLEAMSMGKPVLVSPAAAEGLVLPPDVAVRVLNATAEWIDAAYEWLILPSADRPGAGNREFVLARYSWATCLDALPALLEGR